MTVGVVAMAYGTPASPDDVEAYYTHIRRGRPPSAEQLAEVAGRYRAIGGTSPLAERTRDQAARLQGALDERAPGRFRVVLGFKHAAPFVEDAVAELAAAGASRVVGLVLAPHHAAASVGEYLDRMAAAARAHGLPAAAIESWADEPTYLDLLAGAVRDGLAAMPPGTKVLFTAHSLPERVLDGDPYPDQLRASAAAVAARVGLDRWADWSICWQSAGATPEPWRGPDVRDVIRDLAGTGRATGVLVCPQGFVSEHLEVLYDLDVQAAAVAAEVGLPFARTRVLGDDPTVFGALAERVLALAP
ncbi:MAG: ferrochelatase [Acidimicrobiia bacterium]